LYYFNFRKQKNSQPNISIKRPEVISRYNENMGGVDLLDQLISYYRIFIKSRKWTLRVFFHFMDFALAASWLEYRADCNRNNIPSKKQLDLLNFRLEVTECLLLEEKTAKRQRGRPSLNASDCSEAPIYKRRCEYKPPTAVCLDSVGHLPLWDEKEHATRCKNDQCKGKTHTYCKKCNIHLCFTKVKNCFESFHVK
jgi:hypothetical protein